MPLKRRMRNETIRGRKCTFTKYPNGFVEGRCREYMVGSVKTKKETVKLLKEMIDGDR